MAELRALLADTGARADTAIGMLDLPRARASADDLEAESSNPAFWDDSDAADAVFYMASLPLSANVLQMTVMASKMPLVGRG